jgi:OFA family oxalate/formate antiporter-like MFS transporter
MTHQNGARETKMAEGNARGFALPWPMLRMLIAVGVLYLIMMGSTFFSLGVVLPAMMASLKMNFGEGGFGFTLLAFAAGSSSLIPAVTIRRWNGRATLALGVVSMMLAYVAMAIANGPLLYDVGAVLLGIGFSMIGAVPALHVLSGWTDRNRSLVFGAYLAFGGVGGAFWPYVVGWAISSIGGWRGYWWFMTALIAMVGSLCILAIRERPFVEEAAQDPQTRAWTLGEALRTPQFYIVGIAIAAMYLVASTINAFTVSYLTKIGVALAIAVSTFSIQSACHSIFPLFMGGLAHRIGVKAILVFGLAIQAIGMVALAYGTTLPILVVFAIGVGGGYGTIFLGTTLSLQEYYGRAHYADIFGANQLFSTISVIGPVIIGFVADRTGRFDISFIGCAAMLAAAAVAAATLKPPQRAANPATST